VYESLLESVAYGLHQEGLDNLTVAVQGIGKVGSYLVDYIVQDYPGVSLIIADTDQMKVAEELKSLRDRGINALQAEPNEIYDQQFDVFSPNAMGQIVNPSTIPRMARANRGKKLIIVGAANNQIDERRRGGRKEIEDLLRKHKILYAPDFVVNLGGILNLIYEFESVMKVFGGSYKRERPLEVVHGVRTILREIYDRSAHTGVSTQSIADRLAEEHLARWAVSGGFGPEELLARSYLVDVLPTASGNTVPIS
jgi:leucine dehydrogenase